MNIKLLPQEPGDFSFYEELNHLFKSSKYNSFRGLVAYITWSGLSLIHLELESFYNRTKGRVNFIVGLGGNPEELHSLRYLIQRMSKGKYRIFDAKNRNYTFHPKIYLFTGPNESCILIGSNNLTQGGLYYNTECSISISYKNNAMDEFIEEVEHLWQKYNKPLPPFSKNNLKNVSESFLTNLNKFYSKNIAGKTFHQKNKTKELFGIIEIPNPPVELLPKEERSKIKSKKKSRKKGDILLLEILKETGANGTQVQIPYEVLVKYFNVSTDHKTIQISWENNPIRPAVLCSFRNHTYRVSIVEIASMRRPLLLNITRIGNDLYKITSIRGNQYKKVIQICTNQTRIDAKRWVIK